ncbi:MAG: M20/M25/M40 family metallo-hydrolase [Ferruginibacter sp.]
MNKSRINILYEEAIGLLKELIKISSLSGHETYTADCIQDYFKKKNIATHRILNNVWCINNSYDAAKPTILLNSHHDTIAANAAYTINPFDPEIIEGKLYGLGSTDAGASLVSLAATFVFFYNENNLPFNIIFAATAEEEISGADGIEKLFGNEDFNKCFSHTNSFAIVGEPTDLQLAVAEKGLLVLDCKVYGKAGHAARDEGDNAVYKAMKAIEWFKNYRFAKVSPLLGEIKMTVTSIHSLNEAHNIIPAECTFVVDIRLTELYSHQEIIKIIRENISAEIIPRSTRLRSSFIDILHPVVQAGMALGKKTFGSPTMSDKALIPLPSLKCGPGSSAQSHSADEYVLVKDIEEGIQFYVELIQRLMNHR